MRTKKIPEQAAPRPEVIKLLYGESSQDPPSTLPLGISIAASSSMRGVSPLAASQGHSTGGRQGNAPSNCPSRASAGKSPRFTNGIGCCWSVRGRFFSGRGPGENSGCLLAGEPKSSVLAAATTCFGLPRARGVAVFWPISPATFA